MASAKTSKQCAREHLAQMRAERRRHERRRNLLLGAAIATTAAAVIGAVGVTLALRVSASGIAGLQTFSGLARTHVTGKVSYRQQPPVGGPHDAVWLNCGIYPRPVSNGNAVHSLEHGAVWVTYRPDQSATAVSQLRALVREQPAGRRSYLILSPYPGLPTAVVASAWGKQVRLASASDPRLQRFIAAYVQGPQTPEPGTACSDGTGAPMP
jgi:hypothetical protein